MIKGQWSRGPKRATRQEAEQGPGPHPAECTACAQVGQGRAGAQVGCRTPNIWKGLNHSPYGAKAEAVQLRRAGKWMMGRALMQRMTVGAAVARLGQ